MNFAKQTDRIMKCDAPWSRSEHLAKLMREYLEKYSHLFKWQGKENILHDGCVDGTLTKEVLFPYVKPHVQKLVGIDTNEEGIDWAKRHNHLEGIEYRKVDIGNDEDLLNINEKFDHIFSFFISEWRTDTRAWLEQFSKILNTNGQIFVQAFIDSPIHRSFEKVIIDEKWSKHLPPSRRAFADYTDNPVEYFRNETEATGFTVQFIELEKKSYIVDDCQDFLKHIIDMYYEHWHCIPMELRDSYIQEHVTNFREESIYLKETGKYEMPYEAIIGVLTKA